MGGSENVQIQATASTELYRPLTGAWSQAVGAGRALAVHVFGRGDYTLDLEAGEYAPEKRGVEAAALETFTGSFEPNDRRQDAQPIGPGHYSRLRCNSKDWYSIDMPANSSLSVEVTFSRNRGDLQLKLEVPRKAPRQGHTSKYGNYTSDGYRLVAEAVLSHLRAEGLLQSDR